MGFTVKIRAEALQLLRDQAQRALPQECCGFLAGSGGVITVILPACNFLASPTSFEIAPQELFRLVREIRAQKLEHLGIYHSHPAGRNVPSLRDIERAFYPELAYFILSPLMDATKPVRAFSIRESKVTELTIETEQG